LALALQPDWAMAGALFAGLSATAMFRKSAVTRVAAAFGLMGFLVTLAQPDQLPAAPYVDHILWTGFALNPFVGAGLWIGCLLMILPPIMVGFRTAPACAFFATWAAIIFAAAVGAYPTPLVGYGGSAIVGYFLSLTALRRMTDKSRSAMSSQTMNGPLEQDPLNRLRFFA
jgi:hypothetical protein